jgi:hypothetical protein
MQLEIKVVLTPLTGHGDVLHVIDDIPVHEAPPLAGDGWVHVRSLVPPLHVAEHDDHPDHPPATAIDCAAEHVWLGSDFNDGTTDVATTP